MGAQFEATDFAATGSGSPGVRGILYYENTWGKKPLQKISEDEAVVVALRALDTASEADTATGGIDRHAKIFPIMKRSEEHTSELQSQSNLVCRLLLEKKKR